AYDAAHADAGARLEKVENYLANESFHPRFETRVAEAESVLFVEEVRLHEALRGRDLGFWMVRELIRGLGLGERGVVLLQAGGISREGRGGRDRDGGGSGGGESTERLTRYWRRMGFSEWSDSDEAWLCLDPAEAGEGRADG
ncbi:hypothetical protein LTR53_017765, partial [Teratosphaeriaceae sp. CCFEE 6253]